MSRNWAGGSTTKWRRIRSYVLQRDDYTCQLQVPQVCTHTATHAHHTRGRHITGDNPRYIVAACAQCNLHIGDPTKHTHDPQPKPTTQW